jgi:two-component system, OmpR family, phosphate regulon response regulator PhoB
MRSQTILVACSDVFRAELIARYLQAAGYLTRTTTLGHSAWQIMLKEQPLLVVLDWNMPDLSSLAIVRRARANSRLNYIPIILMGEEISDAQKVMGLEAGADLCLAEALQPKVLVARVRALLRRVYVQPEIFDPSQ